MTALGSRIRIADLFALTVKPLPFGVLLSGVITGEGRRGGDILSRGIF
jgi:hypothetical protein